MGDHIGNRTWDGPPSQPSMRCWAGPVANTAIGPDISECIGLIPYHTEYSTVCASAPFTIDNLHGLNTIPVTPYFASVKYPSFHIPRCIHLYL